MESAKQQIYVGLDIGGTLAKLCIWRPKGVKTQSDHLVEDLTGFPPFFLIFHILAHFEKGDLVFNKFQVQEIKSLFDILLSILTFAKKYNSYKLDLKKEYELGHVFVTGGGAYKYVEELKVFFLILKKSNFIRKLILNMSKTLKFLLYSKDSISLWKLWRTSVFITET